MGAYTVQRVGNQIFVNTDPKTVFEFLERSTAWSWKTQFNRDMALQNLSFEVQGSFFKDNSAAATFDISSSLDGGTVIAVSGDRGNLMGALGGNVFNVGVKKFQNKVLDEAERVLRSA